MQNYKDSMSEDEDLELKRKAAKTAADPDPEMRRTFEDIARTLKAHDIPVRTGRQSELDEEDRQEEEYNAHWKTLQEKRAKESALKKLTGK